MSKNEADDQFPMSSKQPRCRMRMLNQVMRLMTFTATFVVAAALTTDAHAAFIYTLRFGQTNYTVAPGGTVAVSLILREEVTGGDTNRITDTNGVTVADVKVNWDAGGSKVNVAGDAAYGSPDIIGTGKTLTANDVILNQLALTSPFAVGTQISANVREVNVGTLTFTAPAGISTTNITFSDPNPLPTFDNLVIGSGGGLVVIDSVVTYGSGTITNPEPSTFVLTGLGFLGAAAVRRFRRRRGGGDEAERETTAAG